MPSAITYLPPNDKDRIYLGGKSERDEIKRVYQDNLKYYSGDQPKWLVQEIDDPVDDNVTINITKQAIDRTLSFLFPDVPTFQLDPNDKTPDEQWLNDTFKINGGAYFLSMVAQNGALSGHCYIKVLRPALANKYPRMLTLNPLVPISFWKADDPSQVLWYELLWVVGKSEMLQDVVKVEDHWEIYDFVRKLGSKVWSQTNTEVWKAEVAPIIAWPHLLNPNQHYGKPEITQNSRDLNNALNRTASDIGKILRYYATPRTIIIGADAAELVPANFEHMYVINNENAKIANLEMKSDLSSSIAFMQYLNDMFLSLSRVVIMRGTVKDFQRVTNTGVRAVFMDMIAKNELLRWSYGMGLQQVAQSILFVGGKAFNKFPSITWTDPLPTDMSEIVNQYVLEQGNGWVDPKTISQKLGWEWGTTVKNWESIIDMPFIQQVLKVGQATKTGQTQNNANIEQSSTP